MGPLATSNPTRIRLLEAAGEIFAEQGYRQATVRAICARADANIGAVNYHFGDKATLYREVLRYAFAGMHARFPITGVEEGKVEERLHRFVSLFLGRIVSTARSWQGRLLSHELAEPTDALEEVVSAFMRPVLAVLDRIIDDARPALPEEARRLHAMSLIGQCVFFRHARPVLDILYGEDAYGSDAIPHLADHIVGTFLRGLASSFPSHPDDES